MIVFLFHIEIEGKGGWIIGGPKGKLAPLSNYWRGGGGGGGKVFRILGGAKGGQIPSRHMTS